MLNVILSEHRVSSGGRSLDRGKKFFFSFSLCSRTKFPVAKHTCEEDAKMVADSISLQNVLMNPVLALRWMQSFLTLCLWMPCLRRVVPDSLWE